MDLGGHVATRLLSFKKGFNQLEGISGIEWKTLQKGTITFSNLVFDISCIKRELEIDIYPLEDKNWDKFREYFDFARENTKMFYEEHGFSQGFLKEKYDFLKNRTHLIKDSIKSCRINADISTTNNDKLKESIYYSIVVPFIKYENFWKRVYLIVNNLSSFTLKTSSLTPESNQPWA